MYAHPALVRPHFASVFDRPVAVWIARLGTRKAALAARFERNAGASTWRITGRRLR